MFKLPPLAILLVGLIAVALTSCSEEAPPRLTSGGARVILDEPSRDNEAVDSTEVLVQSVELSPLSESKWQCIAPQASLQIVGGEIVSDSNDLIGLSTVAIMNSAGNSYCTGTLIGPHHVLSAAHCFLDQQRNFAVTPAQNIRIGMEAEARVLENIRVSHVIIHENFDFSLGDDIALLVLEGDLPQNVRPVRVARFRANSEIDSVIMAGYGLMGDNANLTGVLRKVESAIDQFYPEIREFDLVDGDGNGTCNGDSGGPAFIQSSEFPACLSVIGITSRGARNDPSGTCSRGNGVNTDARYYARWLECESFKAGKTLMYSDEERLSRICR